MTDNEATASPSSYAFEHAGQAADARFDALSALYDESTTRHLATRGVGPGWRCLDVGAGGGSIAKWLSEQVGPTGYVLATDLNTDSLERLRAPNLEVRRHDIVKDPLPDSVFDLIHTRLVLVHVPERDQVLQRLVVALKPGGWLITEEFDARSMLPDASVNPAEADSPLILAIQGVLLKHGANTRYGRLLPGRLRALGMRDIGAEGRALFWQGGSIGASVFRTNAQHVRGEIISSGLMTEDEFEHELARFDDPEFMEISPIMWTVWGQRPGAVTAVMTTPQLPTKAELLDALRSSGRDVIERVRALPAGELEQGRYENGWNGRQILAHIASIEWTYPRLLDIAKEAGPRVGAGLDPPSTPQASAPSAAQAGNVPTRIAQGGILSYNDRQVAKRADASVDDLLQEFETNRAATIAAVESADEALLRTPIRSAGGITGQLAGVLNAVAVLHVLGHVNDIVGAPA